MIANALSEAPGNPSLLLETFLRYSQEGFIAMDEGGKVTLCSPAAQALLARIRPPARPRAAASPLTGDDLPNPLAAVARRLLRNRQALDVELAFRDLPSGGESVLQIRAVPLPGRGGLLIVHDVSAHRQAERSLERLQAFQALLAEASARLLEQLPTPDLFQDLIDRAAALIPGTEICSLLARREDARFAFVAVSGLAYGPLADLSFDASELTLDLPPEDRVQLIHDAGIVDLAGLDPARRRKLEAGGHGRQVAATLVVPILLAGDLEAILSLHNHGASQAFDQEAVALAEALGRHLGSSLQQLRLQTTLTRHRRRLRLQHERVPPAVVEQDMGGEIVARTSEAEQHSGIPREEAERRGLRIPPSPGNLVREDEPMPGEPAKGSKGGIREDIAWGGRRLVSAWCTSALPDDRSGPVGRLGLVRDPTGLQQAEEVLRGLRRQLFDAIRYSPAATVVFELSSMAVIDANEPFLQLTSLDRRQLLRSRLTDLITLNPGEEFCASLREVRGNRPVAPARHELSLGTGDVRQVLISLVPLTFARAGYAACSILDTTDHSRSEEQLLEAIHTALRDGEWLSRVLVERIAGVRSRTPDAAETGALTPRERQVLERIARGEDNEQIAAALAISRHTVRNYVTRIYEKLRLHSRAEAVVWAREHGFSL